MARKPKPEDTHAAAYSHALRLHACAGEDPSLDVGPVTERPGGLYGANASFQFRDAEGRSFTVIVARQA